MSPESQISLSIGDQQAIFTAGSHGYHTFRIPALVCAADGTLLAFAEARKHGRGDAGEIDLVVRRSSDGGARWGPLQVVASEPGMTCGNPCPVLDRETGVLWLPFCRNLADGDETLIAQGKAPRTVWITHSADHGASWSVPHEITGQVKRPEWTWYATGPGHGIQLEGGRLLIPCDHIVGQVYDRYQDPYHSHVILSDDHGATWRIGGIAQVGTNECATVAFYDHTGQAETPGEEVVYLNCRNYVGEKRRAVAWSRDGGESFGDFGWDETLVEPICQASLIADKRRADSVPPVYFANPAATDRSRLTVRRSDDGCRTWTDGLILHEGPAAYSDLALLNDGTLCCLYERGEETPYAEIVLARLPAGTI